MVQHVVLLYSFPKGAFEIEMMYGIMRYIIKQIANYKARKERVDMVNGQHRLKKIVKCNSQRDTCRRRHHQTQSIARVIMMNAVEDEMQALAPFWFWQIVEYETVQHVFNKGPYEQAKQHVFEKCAQS